MTFLLQIRAPLSWIGAFVLVSSRFAVLIYTFCDPGLTHAAKELPHAAVVLDVSRHGASAWASTFRIDAQLPEGEEQSYFLKVGTRQCSNIWMCRNFNKYWDANKEHRYYRCQQDTTGESL